MEQVLFVGVSRSTTKVPLHALLFYASANPLFRTRPILGRVADNIRLASARRWQLSCCTVPRRMPLSSFLHSFMSRSAKNTICNLLVFL
jgi:hypothetical protein